MKKALITGITGQDGSYLAEFLLNKNLVKRPRDMTLSNKKLKKKLGLKNINIQKQIKNMLKDDKHIV